MSSNFRVLRLSDIRVDERLQMRAGLSPEHIDDIVDALAPGKPPLTNPSVVFQDESIYWLADGFHRYAGHEKAGLGEMPCDIHQGGFREALRYALGANQHTSLKRTNADKRKAVEIALRDEEFGALSNRQIAELCGVSTWFVNDMRCKATEMTFHQDDRKIDKTVTERASHLDDRKIDKADVAKTPCTRPSDLPSPSAETPIAAPSLVEAPARTDPFGRPLAGDLVRVFEERTGILSMVDELEDFEGRIKKLRGLSAGRFIAWPLIEYHLNIVQKQLQAAAPQAVCPECGGLDPRRAICKTCEETGFVAAGRFTALAPVLQAKARAFGVERG